MSKLWGRLVCASLLLSLLGCEDLPSDLDPDGFDDDEDAGQVVDPITPGTPEVPTKPVTRPIDASVAIDATILDSTVQPDTSTPPISFSSVYAMVSASCVSCHGAGKTLDLSTPELAHAQLVGVAAKYAACAGDGGLPQTRVVPGAPESSLLIHKLNGTQSCGKQMPPKALLAPEQIELFRSWVAAGAPAQ